MSNSTSHLDLVSSSQASKEITINSALDAASPAMLYGRRASTTAALTWGYYGGVVSIGGAPTQVANGTVTLAASATNYVEADLTDGSVSANTVGFTSGALALYEVVTGTGTVTSYIDLRVLGGGGGGATSGEIADAIAAHEAAGNPHPGYLTQAEADPLYEPIGEAADVMLDHLADVDPHPEYLTQDEADLLYAPVGGGTETTATMGALIAGATAKTTPVDADMFGLMDSAASNVLKKLSWANIKATLKTYFDTLYAAFGMTVNAQTGTSYAYVNGDAGKLVTHTNAGAIAGTLPQAGSSGNFAAGWWVDVQNRGAGTLTITPTTSTIDGATSLTFATGQGARIVSDGTNYFTQRGGAGASSGGGGTSITGTSGTTGGDATVTGGASTGPAQNGGGAIIVGGSATSGSGGIASLTGGVGSTVGGAVTVAGGAGTGTNSGGAATLKGGTAGSSGGSNAGGAVLVQGGAAAGSAGSAGGAVTIAAANSLGNTGPAVGITAGNAGTSGFGNGFAGGAVTATAGTGGTATSGWNGGLGGTASMTAGAGGNSPSGAGAPGAGGEARLTGGAAGTGGTGNAKGGDVVLTPGAGSGTGGRGHVVLNGTGSTLATTATGGFTCLPTCAGTPTGTPASVPTGCVAAVIDSTNSKLFVHIGGAWKSVTLS